MNDLKWIEANAEEAKRLLKKRGGQYGIDRLLSILRERREQILFAEGLKAKRNQINEQLKSGDRDRIEACRDDMKRLSSEIREADSTLVKIESELRDLSLSIPNLPLADVPDGVGSNDNVVIREVLDKPRFDFSPRDHVELGNITDTIDLARAAKIAGSRFAFLKGDGARLNRALIQLFANFHADRGDIELTVPYLVREQAMIGVGQFPKFVDDVFAVTREGEEPYFLIPTAEVPVTNYLADEIVDEHSLPLRFCAYSPCFRSEAGAAGQDTRGLIRMHQFEKVEMVRFARPEQAMDELEQMVDRASALLRLLELPHRIVELCGGDLGFHAEKTFDLEVFLPGQNTYREISSCSSFGAFQARRAKIRMRTPSGKIEPLVTLNGSGLPLGRTVVAIYENHQNADGSIRIPEVLRPLMGGKSVIRPKG